MNCPVCPTTQLLLAERHGIEIDYCPSCRGVWLDRGELDKVIERAESTFGRPDANASVRTPHRDALDDEPDGDRRGRRGSLLGELFDFG